MATTRKLFIEFGDGASPETFGFSCTLNSQQEFSLEASAIEATEPNCLDPNKPGWVIRAIDTLSANISGEGTMELLSWGALRDRMLAGEAFNVRSTLAEGAAAGGGYFQGAYVMTKLGAAKEGRGFVTCSVELQSAGPVTWTAAI